MQTPMPKWATAVLTLVGTVMVASMFVNWIDVGAVEWSGWRFARSEHYLFLVPLLGAVLAASAATRARHTRAAAIGAGALIVGAVLYDLSRRAIHADLSTLLVLGGAGMVLAGRGDHGKLWRIGGGVAVLAGFFAPWDANSLFTLLTDRTVRMVLDHLGVAMRTLWLIPIAAIAAIATAAMPPAIGRKVGTVAAVAVYGALLVLVGTTASIVLAWGAWTTLGAAAVALAVGLLARGPAPVAAPAKR
jgi:hypothetical protein